MVNYKEEIFTNTEDSISNKSASKSPKIKTHLPQLKKISLLEKCFYFAIILTAISLSISKIYIMNSIENTKDKIGQVQTEIEQNNKKIEDLKQQQNELLRSDRIKAIAEKEGLTVVGD